jgi:hypothetical protein
MIENDGIEEKEAIKQLEDRRIAEKLFLSKLHEVLRRED